jgi:hypothetical protein
VRVTACCDRRPKVFSQFYLDFPKRECCRACDFPKSEAAFHPSCPRFQQAYSPLFCP